MKKILSILLFVLISTSDIDAQTQPPIRILRQVYLFASDTSQGTCFGVDYKNQRYLITAKHIFRKSLKNDTTVKIQILVNNQIKNTDAKYYIHKNDFVDIAVLKLPILLNANPSIDIGDTGSLVFAQDVYFLGYPSFDSSLFYTNLNNLTYPLIKKAIVSGFMNASVKDNISIMLLDGHNNTGFSGGPIVYYDLVNKKYNIAGVISGYFFQKNEIKGDKTKTLYLQENSGIIKCFEIKEAIDIIKQIK